MTPEDKQFQDSFDKAIKKYATDNQYGVSKIPVHSHTGTDSPQVLYTDLVGNPQKTSVANGTYYTGGKITLTGSPGTITITNGVITAVTQAS